VSTPADWLALVDDGRVSLLEALASVDEATRPSGDRALVLRPAGGLSLDVLPDLAWTSERRGGAARRSPGAHHLVDPGPAGTWENRFLGGLLATCGPDNIGPSRGTLGHHGSHPPQPCARRAWRQRTGDGIDVHVRGAVGHTRLYGPRLVVEREILSGTGRPSVEVRDVVRNSGDEPIGVPLLHHVNLGRRCSTPARGSWSTPATPCCGNRARRVAARSPCRCRDRSRCRGGRAPGVRPDDGWGPRRPRRHWCRARVAVEWTATTLPRLCAWNWPARGAWSSAWNQRTRPSSVRIATSPRRCAFS
jgi:hypothetical protein